MKRTTFLDVPAYCSVQHYRRFEGMYWSKRKIYMQLANVKQEERALLLRNVDEFLVDYTAKYRRRKHSEATAWEPRIQFSLT
jgi:hypothetical protein